MTSLTPTPAPSDMWLDAAGLSPAIAELHSLAGILSHHGARAADSLRGIPLLPGGSATAALHQAALRADRLITLAHSVDDLAGTMTTFIDAVSATDTAGSAALQDGAAR